MVNHTMNREEMMYAIAGGILLGIASSLMFLFFGTPLNTTNITKGILKLKINPDFSKKITVIAGIVFSSAFLKILYHEHAISVWFFDDKKFLNELNPSLLMLSGLLVGIGSNLAGGQLFAHIVCGIPRFSLRSIFASLLLSVSAVYTYKYKIVQSIIKSNSDRFSVSLPANINTDYYLLVSLLIPFICFIFSEKKSLRALIQHLMMFSIGFLSGLSLMIGGLTQLNDYYQVLSYERNWDPSILVFFGTAMAINLFTFNFLILTKKPPLFQAALNLPPEKFDFGILIGPIIMGIGVGLAGVNAVSLYLYLPLNSLRVAFYWGLCFMGGIKVGELMEKIGSKLWKKAPSH